MGISRIFMSMHFPSDLLFGAYIGSLTPLLIFDWFFKDKINTIIKSNKISLSDLGKLLYNRFFI
jgi:membrane-associated phospholipid phosphatase